MFSNPVVKTFFTVWNAVDKIAPGALFNFIIVKGTVCTDLKIGSSVPVSYSKNSLNLPFFTRSSSPLLASVNHFPIS